MIKSEAHPLNHIFKPCIFLNSICKYSENIMQNRKKGAHNNTPFSIMETKQLNCQTVLQYDETKENKTMRLTSNYLKERLSCPHYN